MGRPMATDPPVGGVWSMSTSRSLVDGLRVIDTSIFPHITNGNLNAPTIMLAEKLADAIRGQ